MIRAAAMLGLVLATAGAEPPSIAPTLDGTMDPEEWATARTEELTGGGEVRFMTVGDVLYVAVSGAGKGLAHVYVAGGKRPAGG